MEKDKKETHARMPVGETYRKSPFDGLIDHAGKVSGCVTALKKAVDAYIKADYEEFERQREQVVELEHQADLIKGNIRAHLPRFIFMPVSKSDFLMLLREVDSILDYTEDAAVLLSMRYTTIPPEIKEDFIRYTNLVVETAIDLERLVFHMRDLLNTSFSEKEREETKAMIKGVHKKEWDADQLEYSLTKRVFNMDTDPVSIFHLVRVLDRMDQIANHAENAADRVRAMIAK